MVDFIKNLIGNDSLATVIMSLVPLIELKGGIIFACGAGLSTVKAFLLAYLGSTFVFIPIFFLLVPILNLLKKIGFIKGFADKIENYFKDKAEKTLSDRKSKGGKLRSEDFYKKLGVFIFVAIPLPMTGIWTGTAVAVFLNLKFKDVVLPVCLGNFIAGIIISILAKLCTLLWTIESLNYVLWGLLGLAVILLVITVIKISINGKKDDDKI